MREVFTLICGTFMIAASFNCTAQEDMVSYTLVAKSPITGCKIVALKNTEEVGKVESIVGTNLNLRIHRDNVYKVTINEEQACFLQYDPQTGFAQADGIKTTRPDMFTSLAVHSEAASSVESGIRYRVQIGAFTKDVSTSSFTKLGPLYTEEITGGLTRFMIGSFLSKSEAAKTESELRDMGYTDAFTVVCYDGKRVSFDEAKMLTIDQPSNLTSHSNE